MSKININRLIDDPEFNVGDKVSWKNGFDDQYFKIVLWDQHREVWIVDSFLKEDNRKIYSLIFKDKELIKYETAEDKNPIAGIRNKEIV